MQLSFTLPEADWDAIPQAPSTIFAALRRSARTSFRPSIVVSVANDAGGVEAVADATVGRLRAVSPDVDLLDREIGPGGADVARCTQLVECDVTTEAGVYRVIQTQVFMDLQVSREAQTRVVLSLILSADREDMDEVLPEFEAFLRSVEAA